MLFVSGSKVWEAQGQNPQSSSLIKIPLYLTEGSAAVMMPGATESTRRGTGTTSAHHTQGDTPAALDTSNNAKAVPRGSLPAMTRACLTPFTGLLTVVMRNDSQRPCTEETFSLPV